jgi:uncharacterized protein RhaS with RHS repeats
MVRRATRHGFVGGLGHVTDAATGLVYMRARYYEPAVGTVYQPGSGDEQGAPPERKLPTIVGGL